MSTSYSEKLKDPRWQRLRLEILSRDDFTCRICESKTKTLHVHHIRYLRGREPWEYREFYFVTLCEDCHDTEEREIKQAAKSPALRKSRLDDLAVRPTVIQDPDDEARADPPDREELEEFFAGLKGLLAQP